MQTFNFPVIDVKPEVDNTILDWNYFFMSMAIIAAKKSKDRSTQIGAVIVRDRGVVSIGYNGICRKVQDPYDIDSGNEGYFWRVMERAAPPEKYFWYEHAERNAIYNAAYNGIAVADTDIYTNGVPCADCARAIIQSGLRRVFTLRSWNLICPEKWRESALRSQQMFHEAGVLCVEINALFNQQLLLNGSLITV